MTDQAEMDALRTFVNESVGRMEGLLKSILEKHVPISEAQINKKWRAVRETVDEFSNQLVENQLDRQKQNDAIATLRGEVQKLSEQVILMTAMSQGGMKVPDGASD